ncbi:MAG TPA: hypothetical protein VF054_18850 [Micromonosporaceae bacterium]
MTEPVDSTVEPAAQAGRTGDPGVDAALETLDASEGRPLAEQVAAYQRVHEALQATLAQIDEG